MMRVVDWIAFAPLAVVAPMLLFSNITGWNRQGSASKTAFAILVWFYAACVYAAWRLAISAP